MDLCDRKDNAANKLNMHAMTPEVSLKTDRHEGALILKYSILLVKVEAVVPIDVQAYVE